MVRGIGDAILFFFLDNRYRLCGEEEIGVGTVGQTVLIGTGGCGEHIKVLYFSPCLFDLSIYNVYR